jgi:peptidoglycan/LPS O-acetylase OafA/YrhL
MPANQITGDKMQVTMLTGPKTVAPREVIAELYVLRGLALLGVIFQHTLGVYIRRENIAFPDAAMIGMLFNFTKFAVPAFVFATGVALFYNYFDRLDYRKFIRKRFVDILLPYFLWTGIYEVYFYGIPSVNLLWLKEFGKNMVLGTEAYHLWFVVLIFQFYLVYPVLLAFFKWLVGRVSSAAGFALAVGLGAVLYAALMWFSYYMPAVNFHFDIKALQLFFVEYRDRNFIFYLAYFLLGGMAGAAIVKWREFIVRSVSWNGFLCTGLFTWIGYELMKGSAGGVINLNYSTSLKPSMFFYTVSELLLIYGLSLLIVKNSSLVFKLLDMFGKFSYGIYLAHALILVYAVKVADRLMPPGHFLLQSALALILCALVSLGVVVLISKMPYGKLLIGPYKKGPLKIRDRKSGPKPAADC